MLDFSEVEQVIELFAKRAVVLVVHRFEGHRSMTNLGASEASRNKTTKLIFLNVSGYLFVAFPTHVFYAFNMF